MTKEELKKENERLTVSYETLKLHDEEEIGMLKSENAELKKKVLEIGQHLDLTEREWGKDLTKMYHYKTQLTKAKELLERFLGLGNLWDLDCKDYFPLRKEAEQFLSEVEK